MKTEAAKRTPLEIELLEALKEASDHLDWIGYGDSYERQCAREDKLEEKIKAVISKAEA